jgi:(p)ppGpp synthase/HD superfamily hydrolase
MADRRRWLRRWTREAHFRRRAKAPMPDVEAALEVALLAHRGQRDRTGEPYVLHAVRVMQHVAGPSAQMAALLHDVVEKSPLRLDDLRVRGFPPEVVAAVDALTRRQEESYEAYVVRASRDPLARAVKLADVLDHLAPERLAARSASGDDPPHKLRRLLRAYRFLTGGVSEQQYLAESTAE